MDTGFFYKGMGEMAGVCRGHYHVHPSWLYGAFHLHPHFLRVCSLIKLGTPYLSFAIFLRSGANGGCSNHLFFVMILNYSFTTIRFRSEVHTSELQSRFDIVCRL